MADITIPVAEAIKDEVNKIQNLDHQFEAYRTYADLNTPFEIFDELHVSIVAITPASAGMASRDKLGWNAGADIAIRKRFGQGDLTAIGEIDPQELDSLVKLTETIWEHFFTTQRLTTYTEAVWVEEQASIRSIAVPDHLKWGQYTGIVRPIFQVLV